MCVWAARSIIASIMLWVVGKVFSEFLEYLEDNGIEFGVFRDASFKNPPRLHARIEPLDFSTPATLPHQLQHIRPGEVSAIIVAGYENYVLPAACIARHFGVPGPSIEAAHAATDKAVMRAKFMRSVPTLTPDFAVAASWDDIEKFMSAHHFPVMLKPANLMKSLLITKNSTPGELQENYRHTEQAMRRLYRKYSVSQVPKIIIEEFLEGTMHTVAAFADAEGNPVIIPGVADCVTAQEIGFDDNFLYSRALPSALPAAQQQHMYDAAAEGIRALGLTNCPAHVELVLTKKGPKIIEIGARVGGYRPRMYQYGLGIDLQQLMIDTAYGRPLHFSASAHHCIRALELFPDSSGQFLSLTHEREIRQLPSLRRLSIKPRPGQTIGRSSQGYKAAAVVVLASDNPAQLQKDYEFVRANARIQLRR